MTGMACSPTIEFSVMPLWQMTLCRARTIRALLETDKHARPSSVTMKLVEHGFYSTISAVLPAPETTSLRRHNQGGDERGR
jgi:hypothetical protein